METRGLSKVGVKGVIRDGSRGVRWRLEYRWSLIGVKWVIGGIEPSKDVMEGMKWRSL